MTGWEKIVGAIATSLNEFGGVYLNRLSDLFTGIDISLSDLTLRPKIGTKWSFLRDKLHILTTDQLKSTQIIGPDDIDTDKQIVIPALPPGQDVDDVVLRQVVQAFIGKIFDLSANVLSETGANQGSLLVHNGVEYEGKPLGANGEYLQSNGTDVVWATPGALLANSSPKVTVYYDGALYRAQKDDGSTVSSNANSMTVLQAAFNSGLTAGRTWQERVKVKGLMNCTNLLLPSYCTLDLMDGRLFQPNATNLNMIENVDQTTGNSWISIIGGTIDGNKAGQTKDSVPYDTRNAVKFNKVTHGSVENCAIINSNSSAIYCKDSVDTIFKKNKIITPNKLGIYLHSPTLGVGKFSWIDDNYFDTIFENAIGVQGYDDAWVRGNECIICGTVSINAQGRRNHILNNHIVTTPRNGISLCSEGTHIGDFSEVCFNTVENAMTNDSTPTGFTNQAGSHIFVGVSESADRVYMNYNKIFGTASQSSLAHGMRFEHIHFSLCEGNLIYNCNRTGLSASGVNVTFTTSGRVASQDRCILARNIIWNCGLANDATWKGGIKVYGQGTETAFLTNIDLINNICYNNTGYGVSLKNCDTVRLFHNNLVGNSLGPYEAISNVLNVEFDKNLGYVTDKGGSNTQSGDGSTKVFNIPHGLAVAPTIPFAIAGSDDAIGPFKVTSDATNIIVTYPTPPPNGTNNLIWRWRGKV